MPEWLTSAMICKLSGATDPDGSDPTLLAPILVIGLEARQFVSGATMCCMPPVGQNRWSPELTCAASQLLVFLQASIQVTRYKMRAVLDQMHKPPYVLVLPNARLMTYLLHSLTIRFKSFI